MASRSKSTTVPVLVGASSISSTPNIGGCRRKDIPATVTSGALSGSGTLRPSTSQPSAHPSTSQSSARPSASQPSSSVRRPRALVPDPMFGLAMTSSAQVTSKASKHGLNGLSCPFPVRDITSFFRPGRSAELGDMTGWLTPVKARRAFAGHVCPPATSRRRQTPRKRPLFLPDGSLRDDYTIDELYPKHGGSSLRERIRHESVLEGALLGMKDIMTAAERERRIAHCKQMSDTFRAGAAFGRNPSTLSRYLLVL